MKKIIPLPQGGEIELDATQEFISRVAQQFDVDVSDVSDEHYRMFIYSAVKNAVDKAESEL